MSIKKFIKEVCVQDAVYWEYDGPDGFGGSEFKAPTDIKVRWDEETEVVSNNKGEEFISDAQVLTPNDLVEQSYLMLGTVASLPANPDPADTDGAYEIRSMDRHPLFKSESFDVFIAYL